MLESVASTAAAPQHYRSSNRIDLAASLPWFGFLAATVFAMSFAMAWLFEAGGYVLFLVPFFASLALTGAVYLLVVRGHWRNPTIAVLFAALAGIVTYAGYYHLDMVWQGGLRMVWRFDMLPRYIVLRMESDISEEVGGPTPPPGTENPPTPTPVMNWIMFAIDLGVLAGFPAVMVWHRARQPYCERCHAWMQPSAIGFAPHEAPAIASCIEAGDFEQLAALPRVDFGRRYHATAVQVTHCAESDAVSSNPCPVYLSVRQMADSGAKGLSRTPIGGRTLIHDRLMSPMDVSRLLPLFPGLRAFADAGTIAEAERDRVIAQDRENASRREELGSDRIRIEAFPEKTVFTKWNIFMVSMLVLIPAIALLSGLGLVAVGVMLLLPKLDPSSAFDFLANIPPNLGWPIGVAGLALVGYGIYASVRRTTSARDRYFYRKTLQIVQHRSRLAFDPEGDKAMFVELVPRERWQKLMLETATDFGFLCIDERRRKIDFEGDHRRITIPMQALSLLTAYALPGQVLHVVVIIVVNDGETEMELPFSAYEAPWGTSRREQGVRVLKLGEMIARGYEKAVPGAPSPTDEAWNRYPLRLWRSDTVDNALRTFGPAQSSKKR